MGILDSLKHLSRPYDDDDDFYEDETEMETEVRPAFVRPAGGVSERKSSFFNSSVPEYEPPQTRPAASARKERTDTGGKVVNLNTAPNQVVFLKPERYETSKDICDHLQAKRIVLLSLDDTNKDTARRILDFMAGAAYALGGKITRISSSNYIITPYNVNILGGDLMEELESSGFFF